MDNVNDDCIFHIINLLDWNNMLCFGATNTRYRDIVAPFIARTNQIQLNYDTRFFSEVFSVFESYFTNVRIVSDEFFAPDDYYNSYILSINSLDELFQNYQTSAENIIHDINTNATPRLQIVEFAYTMRFIFTDFHYLREHNVFRDNILYINHELFSHLRRGNMVSDLQFDEQNYSIQLTLQINL